jgi:hypothetical protein
LCEIKINKSDYEEEIRDLKENEKTDNDDRVKEIQKLEEKLTSLEWNYYAGEKI